MHAAIFVVDDHRDSAEAVAAVLRHHGHQVIVETNGWRARAILLSEAVFDVTFLDILMPDVTGGEIYQACEVDAPARLRRLAFLTGAAQLVPAWLRGTGLPVIDKPATPELLEQTVRAFAALSCSRGPHAMAPKKFDADDTSRHHLPAILDADNDEESDEKDDDPEEITSVAISKIQRDQMTDHDDDTESFVTLVRYVRRKHNKVVRRIEEKDEADEERFLVLEKRVEAISADVKKYLFAASVIFTLVMAGFEIFRTMKGH